MKWLGDQAYHAMVHHPQMMKQIKFLTLMALGLVDRDEKVMVRKEKRKRSQDAPMDEWGSSLLLFMAKRWLEPPLLYLFLFFHFFSLFFNAFFFFLVLLFSIFLMHRMYVSFLEVLT
jgi:hypothetical protein